MISLNFMSRIKPLILLSVAALFSSCKPSATEQRDSILKLEKELMNGNTLVADSQKAASLCAKYMDFSSRFPEDSLAAEFLFRAGDLAQGIGDFTLSLRCYDTLLIAHPAHTKAPAAFFMQAFVIDQRIGDKKLAAEMYHAFLQKYPEHQLSPSAKVSLDQINSGMSDEDLVRMFQQKADSIEKASAVKR